MNNKKVVLVEFESYTFCNSQKKKEKIAQVDIT